MAIASVLVGIMTGLISFVAALIIGHGLLAAAGIYVLAGTAGLVTTLALGLLRNPRDTHAAPVAGLAAVQI